jgi:cytochrome c oxidase subunit 2
LPTSPATPPTDAIWYGLYHYYLFLGFAAGTVVISWMLYNVFVNRKRRGTARQAPTFRKEETGWGNLRGILMILLVTGSTLAFVEYQTFGSIGLYVPPKEADHLSIMVIGRQWDWTFVYPNGVRMIGNLTVPQGEEVLLTITSVDVAHSLSIPALSVGEDAVPGHNNTAWFNATQLGTFTIRCKELCGVGHALMIGTLDVVTQSAYDRWYSSLQVPTAATNQTTLSITSASGP